MKTLEIHGITGVSSIQIGERLQHLQNYVEAEKTIIVTDANVKHFYLKDFPPYDIITIETGEKIKTLDTVRHIYRKLVELEADRSVLDRLRFDEQIPKVVRHHPLGPVLGRIDAHDRKSVTPHFLDAGPDDPVGLLERLPAA